MQPSEQSPTGSRTGIHITLALIATAILISALVAAPWFSQNMPLRQRHMIQSVASADLQLVLEAQREFHEKYGFYTTDLKALEIAPKTVLYKFGFLDASESFDLSGDFALDPSRKDLDALTQSDPNLKKRIKYSPVTKLAEIDFAQLRAFCSNCTASKDTFKAIAAANLDEDDALDVWTINEKGEIEHLQDDFKVNPTP